MSSLNNKDGFIVKYDDLLKRGQCSFARLC